jgi:hypothetical protein
MCIKTGASRSESLTARYILKINCGDILGPSVVMNTAKRASIINPHVPHINQPKIEQMRTITPIRRME